MTPRVRLWNLVLVAWILCHPGSAVTVVEVPHTALKYGRAWNWDSPNDAIGCPHAWTNIDVASFGFSFTGARLQIYLPRRPDGGGDLLLQVDQESHIISLNDTFYTCNNVIYDGVDMPYGEHTVYAEFVKYLPDETLSVWKLQYTVPDEQVLTSLTTITTLPITTPRPISTPTRSSTSSTISSSGVVDPNPTKPPLNVGSIVGGVLGGVAFLIIICAFPSLYERRRKIAAYMKRKLDIIFYRCR
ncbi:hypothetical protein FRC03_006004 [Tulasnella sp. 419]|nr:hypothetical protein FRC03_006004 [Tulasnella sp. 419]